MVEFLLELLCSWFFWAVGWIFVLPSWLLLTTPYVLVIATMDSLPYGRAVLDRYRRLFEGFVEFWTKIGW